MVTIFAEKPDMARKIACAIGTVKLPSGETITFDNMNKYEKALKAIQQSNGGIPIVFHGEDCIVTHGYGHLCQLLAPEEYDDEYKKWKMDDLPIIPSKYYIKPTANTISHFRVVKKLFNKSDWIINATDWDREGEVIFAYVYQATECKKPFKRAYYNSLDQAALQKAFDHLVDASEVYNLEQAGRCRGIADWLIGMNLTRAATLAAKKSGVVSIGRVQTPTLAMVVEREKAIQNFKQSYYYSPFAKFTTENGETYEGEIDTKYEDKEKCNLVISQCTGKAHVVSVEKKITESKAPSLYSLGLLQMDANSKYGFTANETLEITQSLYEGGYVTYPRTNSAFLPDDYAEIATETLHKLSLSESYKTYLTKPSYTPNKRYFNSKKVESHFAIIPTGVLPTKLTEKQQKVYDLICKSLIMAAYPSAKIERVTVKTDDHGVMFVTKGNTILEPGWMEVGEATTEKFVPPLKVKQSVNGTYESKSHKTKPPERYTDKSLIAAMMAADKDADSEDLQSLADLGIKGIGQESTRASIIDKLVERNYIERQKKAFVATPKGISVIDNLPISDLKSAQLTAKWENRLSDVEHGTENSDHFIHGIEELTKKWCSEISDKMTAVSADHGIPSPLFAPKSDLPPCPVCGNPLVRFSWGFGCSGYKEGCKWSLGKICGKQLTDKQVETLLKKKKTSKISGFISKSGKKFDAFLVLKENGSVGFEFANSETQNKK